MARPCHRLATPASRAFRLPGAWLLAAIILPHIVLGQVLYWDTNGNTTGAGSSPSGTWINNNSGGNRNWTSNSAGTTATARWNDNNTAIFSAGSDATGAYTVTVSGTVNVHGITVEEGSPTFTEGTINFSDSTPDLTIASGAALNWGSTTLTSTNSTLNVTNSGVLNITSNLSFSGTVNFTGGTLRLTTAAVSFTTLNITGNTTLDFAGSASSLSLVNFSISSGVTLTITNWADAVDVFSATNWTDAVYDTIDQAPMNQVVFSGATMGTGWRESDSQIRPIPEPSTYGAMLLAALTGFFLWRRHRRKG
jgi:hypothetical protein